MATDSVARALALSASGGGSGAVNSVNGKTGTVTLYGTDINMSTDTSLPTVTEQISSNKTNIGDLATQMGNKQDKLTAGTNITIDANNVISASGGGSSSGAVKYSESQSLTDSQKMQARANQGLPYTSYTTVTIADNKSLSYSTSSTPILYCSFSSVWGNIAQVGEKFYITVADATSSPTHSETVECEVASVNSAYCLYKINTDVTDYTFFEQGTTISLYESRIVLYKKSTAGTWAQTTLYVTITYDNPSYQNILPNKFTNFAGTGFNAFKTNNCTASGSDSASIGYYAQATSAYSVAIGSGDNGANNPSAQGDRSIAIGYGANASGTRAISIGQANTTGQGAIAIGTSEMTNNWVARPTAYPYCFAIGATKCYTNSESGESPYEYPMSYGAGSFALGYGKKGVIATSAVVLGRNTVSSESDSIVLGQYNTDKYYEITSRTGSLAIKNVASYDAWSSSHGAYAVGDIVKYSVSSNTYPYFNGGSYALFECVVAHTASSDKAPMYFYGDQIYWKPIGDMRTGYPLVIGNGTGWDATSNALTVDWDGNLVCNNIPAAPATDGTYNLQVSIVDGVATYSWVAQA